MLLGMLILTLRFLISLQTVWSTVWGKLKRWSWRIAASLLRGLGLVSGNHKLQTNFNIIKEAEGSSKLEGGCVLLVWKSSEGSQHSWLESWGFASLRVSCSLHTQFAQINKLFFLSLTPEIVSTPSSPEEEDKSILNAAVLIDDSMPTTKIQIRLADGSRLVQRFNSTHR